MADHCTSTSETEMTLMMMMGRNRCTFLGFFSLFLWSLLANSYAEIVTVETPRDAYLPPCVFPSQFSATVISRETATRMPLLLKRNDVTLRSPEVVLMSSLNNGSISFETQKSTSKSAAYHSSQQNAAFVLKCRQDKGSQSHYFVMTGSFFSGGKKFILAPATDDVILTASKVTASYVMTETREFSAPGDHGFIALEREKMQSIDQVQREKKERRRRATENYILDILPVVDYSLYQSWLARNSNDQIQTTDALTEYLANIFTSIGMRLGTLALNDVTLSVSVIPAHISTSAATSPYSEDNKEADGSGKFRVNATKILEDFRVWVSSEPGLPQHDHAMLFTSLSLFAVNDGAKGFNITKGLAYVGTICRPNGASTSVLEETGEYQSEGVASHEFGHSLGSLHDGQDNGCTSFDRYVMSDGTYPMTLINRGNSWTFSPCSSSYISDIITELENDAQFLNDCLKSTTANSQIADTISVKDFDNFCTSFYGAESFVCRGEQFLPASEMCDTFYCRIPGTNNCGRLFTPAGTCCGNGKFCVNGQCTSEPSSGCNIDESCPFGDQPGVVVNGQTCAQMHSAYCYIDDIKIKCCATCKQRETGSAGCLYGDKQLGCAGQSCGGTLATGIHYDVICCGTCSEDCIDSKGIQRSAQNWTCPQYIQQYGVSECYSKNVHSAACCETCERHRTDNSACPFGDNVSAFNCHLLPPLGRLCTAQESGFCCQTCPAIASSLATQPSPSTTEASSASSSTPDTTNPGNNNNKCQRGTSCDHATSLPRMSFYTCTLMSLLVASWMRII